MADAILAAAVLRGCFLVMSADLYLHSHTDVFARHACLLLSLAGVAVHRYEVYLSAIAAWAIALVIHLAQSEVVAGENEHGERDEEDDSAEGGETGKAAATREPALPQLPSAVIKLVDDSKKAFLGNIKDDVNCDGCAWTVVKDTRGIKVLCSDYPGKSLLRWKVEMEVVGSAQAIYEQLFHFDQRLGDNGWDTALETGKELCEFADGYALQTYTTAAVAGGAIGSRRVLDVRHLDFNRPHGGFCLVNLSVDDRVGKTLPGWLNNDKMKRAKTLAGGGILVEPVSQSSSSSGGGAVVVDKDQTARFKYTLVNIVDLNVWVPTSIINTAMGGAMLESHQALAKQLEKVTGQEQPTGKKRGHVHQD